MYTWTYDAADGVYKNHFISNALLEQSAIECLVAPFTKSVDGYGKRQGQTVNLFHYKDADTPDDPSLEEDTRIPVDKLEMGTRAITVQEWGRGAEYTHLAQQLSKFDPETALQKILMKQLKRCLDQGAAAAFKTAKVKFIPTSLTGGTWDVDGVASSQATHNVTLDHLGIIRDYMINDLHVPFYEGNNYVSLATTKFLRGVKSDRRFEAWNMYLRKGDVIFNSEVGRAEQIRFVEVTHDAAFSNSVGTAAALGEAVVFGDEAVARVEAEAPHLRANPNFAGDFGRKKAVAWYGIIAFATWWDTANDQEAKIVHVTSAAAA